MSMNVKETDATEFEARVASGKTVVCDFWAAWCGPCRMLAPVLDKVAAQFKERAEFVKVNIDENGEIAEKYSVMSIPYVAVFRNGALKTQNIGYCPEDVLKEFLEKNI